MSNQNPEKVEQEFFRALTEADQETLDKLLTDDFSLIDVMTGSELSKAEMLEIVAARSVRFEEINRIDFRVRFYGAVAVITGQTEIIGGFNGRRFEVDSRYTHVFEKQLDGWRMVAAQGTQIVPPPAIS